MNSELLKFCENQGIRVENTVPYCSFQNGRSEKLNRTIIETARTLIAEYSLDHELWGEAVYTATYIFNRIPTVENIIPAEKWLGEKPDYAKLKTFGCTAYDLIPSEKRAGKFDEKSKKMIFVGNTTNGTRSWDPDARKIVRSRHVVFNESPVKQLNLATPAAESEENVSEVINLENDNLETVQNDVVQQGEEPNEQVTQKREGKLPN
ncbi:form3 [Trypoxylus dichotomus]